MLNKVTIRRFKGIDSINIPLGDTIVFVGPNNSSKTSALQALFLWNYAINKWEEKRGKASRAKQRVGVPISRSDLVAPQVAETKYLWNARKVYSAPNRPSMIEILVDGGTAGKEWAFGMEIQYSNDEQVLIRPMRSPDHQEERMTIPSAVRDLNIVYLPALSGIQQFEEPLTLPSQNKRIGEGRAGDVIRNLIYDVYKNHRPQWEELKEHFLDMFQVQLCAPKLVGGGSQLAVEYHTGLPDSAGKNSSPRVEIGCGGSGFLQALLLFSFLYARTGNVILLDEPDAHFEVVRQRDIYSRLKSLVAKRCAQLIVATHSEVIYEETDFDEIITFPHGAPLGTASDKAQFRKILTLIPSSDYISAQTKMKFLYTEDYTDRDILTAWAHALKHPAEAILRDVPWKAVGNNISSARTHFHGLEQVCPNLRGMAVFDQTDATLNPTTSYKESMWKRREIENYLLVPSAIVRFCQQFTSSKPDTAQSSLEFFADQIDQVLKRYLTPPAIQDPFGDHPQLTGAKASDDILVPFFRDFFGTLGIYNQMPKKNLYRLAEIMEEKEIHMEVRTVLDSIYSHLTTQ